MSFPQSSRLGAALPGASWGTLLLALLQSFPLLSLPVRFEGCGILTGCFSKLLLLRFPLSLQQLWPDTSLPLVLLVRKSGEKMPSPPPLQGEQPGRVWMTRHQVL